MTSNMGLGQLKEGFFWQKVSVERYFDPFICLVKEFF